MLTLQKLGKDQGVHKEPERQSTYERRLSVQAKGATLMECKICKSEKILKTTVVLSGDYPLYKCLECSLKFLIINKEISKDYWGEANQKVYSDVTVNSALGKKYDKYLSVLKATPPPNYRLLDVGSGIGIFLNKANSHGFEPTGIEPSKIATEIAKKKYPFSFFQGYLTSDGDLPKKFGVVTAWDVIEHVPDPNIFIKACSDHLVQDGVLILETPNEDALIRKVIQILAPLCFWTRDIRKNIYYHTQHLYYFSKKALEKLLTDLFFVNIKFYHDFTIFEKSLQKLKLQRNYSRLKLFLMKMIYSIIRRVPIFANKTIIICTKK